MPRCYDGGKHREQIRVQNIILACSHDANGNEHDLTSTGKTPWLSALVVNSVLDLSTSQEPRLITSGSDQWVSRDGSVMLRCQSCILLGIF
jgi:hypothetical protein